VRVPEIVYRLARAPASSGPLLELFSRFDVASATATSVTLTFNGPQKDRLLILTNISLESLPGATQAATRINVTVTTPAGLGYTVALANFLVDADERQSLNWQGELMVGGGGTDSAIITFTGNYDAGVASNQIQVGLFGYVIPRGNVAPF